MFRILVASGSTAHREQLEKLILDMGYRVVLADSADLALLITGANPPDLALVDNDLPDADALHVQKAMRGLDAKMPVILISSAYDTSTAIEATKSGAYDFVLRPYDQAEMTQLVSEALRAGRLMRQQVELLVEPQITAGEALIGRSRPMQEVYKAIGRAAPTDTTVLIQGESGTGKELAARAIYQHSERSERPYVVVNCVAIPETLLESELFGYERGAFTGANARRIGKIEQADGGTVFLDEIGDMPPAIQSKILRLLQERSIERIGGRQPIAVNVRIIAATNRDLALEVREGRFREDLYFRLNVVPLKMPPLRERAEDVPLLCDYFLARITSELGVRNPGISADALTLLTAYAWPGNVRELANAMEKCLILGHGEPVGPDQVRLLVLGEEVVDHRVAPRANRTLKGWVREHLAAGQEDLLGHMVSHMEKVVIEEALALTKGNKSRAARILGLSRPSLLARLDKYGLR